MNNIVQIHQGIHIIVYHKGNDEEYLDNDECFIRMITPSEIFLISVTVTQSRPHSGAIVSLRHADRSCSFVKAYFGGF